MDEPGPRIPDRLALLAVLVVAAALRFAGITHHLARAGPEYDERTIFVEPVLRMWRTGSLDPTVYTGYAGFFNHLAAIPVAIGQRLGAETGAAAAARGLVAVFGVVSVALVHGLARRHAGPAAGILAAALLAVSPLEVRSAHYVTPDVLVGTAMLGALLVLARGPAGRAEAIAGVALGAATAVKYTGLLLAPAIAADRLARGRARGLFRVGLAAALAFAACAPFALLHLRRQGAELAWALQSYYGRDAAANRFVQGDASAAAAPLLIVAGALGPVGCALALASILVFRPRRLLVPALVVVVAATVVLLPANLIFPRHLVPVAVVTPLLAASGWRGVGDLLGGWRARRALLAILALAALAPPASASWRLVARYLQTPAVDRAAEWIEARVSGPALVAVSLDRFALDPARFEVRTVRAYGDLAPEAPEVTWHYDLLVTTRREADGWPGFTTVSSFESEERDAGLALLVRRPLAPRGTLRAAPASLRASHDEDRVGAAWDDDPDSVWQAPSGLGWVEAHWEQPLVVERVDIEVGKDPDAWPQDISFQGSHGATWSPLAVVGLRPNRPAKQRVGGPHGQIYVLAPPRLLRGLRIERGAGGPWSLATVRVFEERRPTSRPTGER
jgi:4-amino-4-deoxy-L-arabinose transferase-like glycosyltransferase